MRLQAHSNAAANGLYEKQPVLKYYIKNNILRKARYFLMCLTLMAGNFLPSVLMCE